MVHSAIFISFTWSTPPMAFTQSGSATDIFFLFFSYPLNSFMLIPLPFPLFLIFTACYHWWVTRDMWSSNWIWKWRPSGSATPAILPLHPVAEPDAANRFAHCRRHFLFPVSIGGLESDAVDDVDMAVQFSKKKTSQQKQNKKIYLQQTILEKYGASHFIFIMRLLTWKWC